MNVLRCVPRLVSPVWGGSALARRYHKGDDPHARIGESWEVWRDNAVVGREGTLGDVVDLPLLVKLLDTREALSVQVHPGDADARRLEGAENGKSEGWVVIDAAPGARVAYGLTRELTADELRTRAQSGAIADDLAWIEVAPGDVIDVPPGTIHAIGGGLLLYEIQQPSDLTYRLYDYGRGRELHLDKAVEVATRVPVRPTARPRPLGPGREEILRSRAFRLERLEVPTCASLSLDRPAALTVVEGEVWIDGEKVEAGASVVLLPGVGALGGEGVALLGYVPPNA